MKSLMPFDRLRAVNARGLGAAFLVLVLSIGSVTQALAVALPSAAEVLSRSLAYHDPQQAWSSKPIEFTVEVRLAERLATARGYETRTDRVVVNNASGRFYYWSEKQGNVSEIIGNGDVFTARLNGSSDISAADRETHRLTPDRFPLLRNYFSYMLGIPMKLRDPGTLLGSEVRRTEFAGREVLALRVTYDPDVGGDVWYFYVDPATHALVGCRFYHDESKADGEFLTFEGEIEGPYGLRLPRRRLWHMNKDGEYIAVDDVVSITAAPKE